TLRPQICRFEGSDKIVVLGQTVATNLFGSRNPVGEIVRVGQVPRPVLKVLVSRASISVSSGFPSCWRPGLVPEGPLERVRPEVPRPQARTPSRQAARGRVRDIDSRAIAIQS